MTVKKFKTPLVENWTEVYKKIYAAYLEHGHIISLSQEEWQTLSGRMAEITFFDACSFWRISPRSSAMHLEAKLAHIKETLYQVKEYVGSGTIAIDRSSEVSAGDIDRLIKLHSSLQNVFAEELDVIRQRTDERQLA